MAEDGIPFTSFSVDDVRAEFERLKGLGVRFTQEPTEMGSVTMGVQLRGERPRRPRRPRAVAVLLALAAVASPPAAGPVLGQSDAPEAFLDRLTGEWSVVAEAVLGPGQEPIRSENRAVARRVGGWLVTETTGAAPDGRPVTSIYTLGHDSADDRFRGAWISSMQEHLWIHTGELDESGTVLTLDTEGPILGDPTTSAEYREIIEAEHDDQNAVRSMIRGPDGEWFEFARAEYRR